MKTITKTYNVYTYSELSDEAKNVVNRWYLDDSERVYEFEDDCIESLKNLFPHSDLKVQFSLSYSQGDGLNIYGKFNLYDLIEIICGRSEHLKKYKDVLSEKEVKTILNYMEDCGGDITLPYNDTRYSYCVARRTDFSDDWCGELEYRRRKNIQVKTIRKLESLVVDMFTVLAKEYENAGYKYLYKPDEEEIEATCEANNWEFLEDGTFFSE